MAHELSNQYQRTPPTFPIASWLRTYPDAAAAIACALLTLLGWAALQGNWVGLGVWILLAGYVIGGYESAREGLTTLWEERELDVDLLMIVAALGAAGLGLWQQDYHLLVDGSILILIFAFSGALETIATQRTASNIRALMQIAPDTARVLRDNREQMMSTSDLQVGDRILVKPGEFVPTDGLIASGSSTLNEAPITGESMPVEKTAGDEVFGGTVNGAGALTLEIHKSPESSLIRRVISLVEQAQTTEPPSQQFLERFERGYARAIVVTGILLGTLPPVLLGWNWETTIYRALVFLVVASPCALMAAIMPALLSAIANGARNGILFKDGTQLERMARVRAIAFDKTGTLTTGQVQVGAVIPAPGVPEDRVLQLAASLEVYSEHPIGEAIVNRAKLGGLDLIPATDIQAKAGLGIVGNLEGKTVRVGKVAFACPEGVEIPAILRDREREFQAEGQSAIWVVCGDELLGIVTVADQIRTQAPALLDSLRQMGIESIVMLTGDHTATANSVAASLGIDRVFAELLPEDKVDAIADLQRTCGTVAMVGDGINDAPALARADVGIAMGGAGTDVALETADVVLMADRLEKLVQAVAIGRRSQRIIKQNIAFALASIAVLLCVNFIAGLTMPLGVLGHEGSTLLVTLNGLRMLRG
ncbi:MAG: heavy metal translocating P-type ATPase [Limnospira sp.]